MAIKKHTHGMLKQLVLELDLPDTLEELNETPAEVALRLEAARTKFDEREQKPGWFGVYTELIEAGWDHKRAMYIAWASAPRKDRQPGTVAELADWIGLKSPRVIYTWRSKNPAIDETVAVLQAEPLFQHRADVFHALVSSATDPNYKSAPDRRTFFTLTGDLVEEKQLRIKRLASDLSDLTEEELAALEVELSESKGPDDDD